MADTSFTVVALILAGAAILNAYADYRLLRGVRYTDWDPGFDALVLSSFDDLRVGTWLGGLTVVCWLALLLPMATALPNELHLLPLYAAYVGATLVFHVAYGFAGVMVKQQPELKALAESWVTKLALCSFLTGAVFSIVWAVEIWRLPVSSLYYLATPAAAIVIFQFVIGRLLRRVPYYLAVSGPIAMFWFFAGFLLFSRELHAASALL